MAIAVRIVDDVSTTERESMPRVMCCVDGRAVLAHLRREGRSFVSSLGQAAVAIAAR